MLLVDYLIDVCLALLRLRFDPAWEKFPNVKICVRLLKTELHRIENLTECETDIFMHFLASLDKIDDFFKIHNRKKKS